MSRARSNRITWQMTRLLGRLFPDQMARRLRNQVFFIGCGRSGTTILSGLLSGHPRLAVYPTEANDLWHPRSYPWHTAELDTPPFWSDAATFTRISLAARRPEDDRRLKGMFGAFQFLAGGDIFLNKSVMVTFMIPQILDLFPTARFIHIVRDGRAVAHSYARKEGKKIAEQGKYGRKGYDLPMPQLLETFAAHWQDHVEEIERRKAEMELAEDGRLFELSYEALCDNTAETLNTITNFLNVSPNMLDAHQLSTLKNMNYKYQQQLESTTIQTLTTLIAPTLDRYGYAN